MFTKISQGVQPAGANLACVAIGLRSNSGNPAAVCLGGGVLFTDRASFGISPA